MEKNNEILENMNAISRKWSDQFENTPALKLSFGADAAGNLTINGEVICPIKDVAPATAFVDVEYLGFFTNGGDEYRIYVEWPYEGTPYLSHLSCLTKRKLNFKAS